MPLLPAPAVDYLLNHARITGLLVTVYSVNGFPQTFPAVIRRECLPIFEAELRSRTAWVLFSFPGCGLISPSQGC